MAVDDLGEAAFAYAAYTKARGTRKDGTPFPAWHELSLAAQRHCASLVATAQLWRLPQQHGG